MRHRVRIQERTEAKDSSTGYTEEDWTDKYTKVPADIQRLQGTELIAARQLHASVNAVVVIRWLPDVNELMRIIHDDDGGRIYDVRCVLPAAKLRGGYMRLACESGLNRGG